LAGRGRARKRLRRARNVTETRSNEKQVAGGDKKGPRRGKEILGKDKNRLPGGADRCLNGK